MPTINTMQHFTFICLTLVAIHSQPSAFALSIIQNALDNWSEGRTDDILNAGVDSGFDRQSDQSCTDECLKRLVVDVNQPSDDKISCSRGCRFQVLAQLLLGNALQFEKDDPRGDTCESMCHEAYAKSVYELKSCQIGCLSYQTNQLPKPIPVIAEFSWSWLIDGGNPIQLEGGASEPDDVLTDPSLRSQIQTIETVRLPELRLKTIPSFVQDKPAGSICGSGTVSGVPYCFVWSFLLLITLLGLWSCLSLDEQASSAAALSHRHAHGMSGDEVKKLLILKDERCSAILGLDDDLVEDDVDYLSSPLPLKYSPPPPYSESA